MKDTQLIGVQITTTEGQLIDYGILEASEGSMRLITPRFKGSLLGGATLLAFVSIYYGLLLIPFVLLHVSPITQWDVVSRSLFALALPVGFIIAVFFRASVG